jgi:RecA-family ATPase
MAKEFKSNWLIRGIIERGNLGLFFGNSAGGKSLLVQDMCFCIAAGLYFKGIETQQGKVVYICGEGFSGLQKRFKSLELHYGQTVTDLHYSECPAAFMDTHSAIAVSQAVDAIGDVCLIVVDTLHRNLGAGDENSAQDIGIFLNNIDTYLRPKDAAVLIIHHSGHDAKERSRSSSSIRAVHLK